MDDHQKNESASPSKNALRIKLRTYGDGGAAEDLMTSLEEDGLLYNHNKQNQRPGNENRICKVCKKGFSSGRALGGHMRVHAKAREQEHLHLHLQLQEGDGDPTTNHILPIPNTPIIPKLKLISKPQHHHRHGDYKRAGIGNSAAAGGGPLNVKADVDSWTSTTKANINSSNPRCSLCGKKFPSMKSLFGHMRCHPEREWRGIQPPPPPPLPPPLVTAAAPKNTSVSSSSTVSDKDSCGGHDQDHDHNHYHYHYHDQRGKIEIKVDDHQLDSSLSTTARSSVNLAESLSSWSLTAKRGRKAIAMNIAAVPPPRASASASEETESIRETEAAYHLMMLAHGNPLGECFPSGSNSNSNSKQKAQASVPCFRPKNAIGNPRNLGDLAKKQIGGDDGSQSQSQSGGSRNREYPSFPKKLKIDVESSLTLSSPSSRRDEEQLETSRIVQYDDSIHSKCLKLKADKGHSAFAPNFDLDPVVEQMYTYCTSTTLTWDSYAGGGLQGSRKQSRREEEEEGDGETTDDDSSDGDQRDQPDELTCISQMIVNHQKLNKQKRGRKKKKMKLRDLERLVEMGPNPIKYKKQHKAEIRRATASPSDRFRCWNCNKTFTSHQALGGHRSSHKIGKNSQSSPIPPITTSTTTAGMDDSAIAGDDHPTSSREEGEELRSQSECVTHRCKICNKAFPTGRALGGHQRLHWTSTAECDAAVSAAAPSSSVASREDIYISKAGGGRGMLEFDLNEMPEASMEEDNESPYNASSSYNSIT